jgi:hypothetical protein
MVGEMRDLENDFARHHRFRNRATWSWERCTPAPPRARCDRVLDVFPVDQQSANPHHDQRIVAWLH